MEVEPGTGCSRDGLEGVNTEHAAGDIGVKPAYLRVENQPLLKTDSEALLMNLGRSAREHRGAMLSTIAGGERKPRQVVTLAFLDGRIPDSFTSEQLARSLCAETRESVVLVRLERQIGATETEGGAQSEPYLNGEFHMPPEVGKADAGFHSLALGVRNDPPTPAGIASLVGQLSHHFRYVHATSPQFEPIREGLNQRTPLFSI